MFGGVCFGRLSGWQCDCTLLAGLVIRLASDPTTITRLSATLDRKVCPVIAIQIRMTFVLLVYSGMNIRLV